jgi:hypothetical protein
VKRKRRRGASNEVLEVREGVENSLLGVRQDAPYILQASFGASDVKVTKMGVVRDVE